MENFGPFNDTSHLFIAPDTYNTSFLESQKFELAPFTIIGALYMGYTTILVYSFETLLSTFTILVLSLSS